MLKFAMYCAIGLASLYVFCLCAAAYGTDYRAIGAALAGLTALIMNAIAAHRGDYS